ncbi:phosphorylase [Streptomyces paromomycinus]|uniref:Uridine phosphorylase n=1 Tax=Streptomyces paromomycinus TaxID=92743 RepID=A0A401VUY2_STREY|nr:phosphorylase [Streptomyces paromomycinus]
MSGDGLLPGPGKHTLPAVTDPAEHAAYVRSRHPHATLSGLAGVILVYQRTVLYDAHARFAVHPLPGWARGELGLIERHGATVGLCGGFGPGAPAAGLVLEQLIALGARTVITVGTAASLQTSLTAGDVVVCSQALRDEGLSRHYLAPARYARPASALSRSLHRTLRTHGLPARTGAAWSTDAPYRETVQEVTRYGAEGILVADMEAAAVFAVAEYRGTAAAATFVVADALVNRRPRTDAPHVRAVLGGVVRTAVDTLAPAP